MIHFQKSGSELDALIAQARQARLRVQELAFKEEWEERKKRERVLTSLLAKIAKFNDKRPRRIK